MNSELTKREREAAAAVATGATNKQVAEQLGIGIETAKEHVSNAMKKLGVRSRVLLAKWYLSQPKEPPAVPNKHSVFLVLGSGSTLAENGESCISEYSFDTLAELNAFLKGVDEAIAWSDCFQADTREEALQYLREAVDGCEADVS